MGSRWVRTVVVIVALAMLGFAGNRIRLSNQTLAEERRRERDFAELGWTLTRALADLRSAQQAYVADGRDRDSWTGRADTHVETVSRNLEDLRRQVAEPDTFAELDAVVEQILTADEDARALIGSDQPLQASDVIFDRALDLFDGAMGHVRTVLQNERTARGEAARTARATQARMPWIAAGVIGLSLLLLAPSNKPRRRDGFADAAEDEEEDQDQDAGGLSTLSLNGEPAGGVRASLRTAGGDAVETAGSPPAGGAGGVPGGEPSAGHAPPDLRAAAALCTDFGNLTDQAQLPDLLARTAELMNASGIIVWVGDAGALRPALGHGYSTGTLKRIGPIPRNGTDPTAAAFTSGRIQIVASGGSGAGALAAPLMAAERCVGVLAVELRNGWESNDAVQATATIVAAQLAPLLPSAAPAAEPPSAGAEPPSAGAEPPSAGAEPPSAGASPAEPPSAGASPAEPPSAGAAAEPPTAGTGGEEDAETSPRPVPSPPAARE